MGLGAGGVPDWVVLALVAPLLPAAGAFLLGGCVHPAPRGWPFARGAAAATAYWGWMPAWIGLYDLVGLYARYYTVPEIARWVGLFLAFSTGGAGVVTFLAHRRILRVASVPAEPPRRALLRKGALYHALAIVTALVTVPQGLLLSSRGGPYLLLFLPLPFFLFTMGSVEMFWAAVSPEPGRVRRNLFNVAVFHSLPMLFIVSFAYSVLVAHVIPGEYTWRDPYYQTIHTDLSLAVTPFLGFGMLATLVYILATEAFGRRGPRQEPATC